MKKILLLGIICIAQISWGRATEFGNGGYAVVCPMENGDSVTPYDLNESVIRYNLTPTFPYMISSDCQVQKNGNETCGTGTDIAKIMLSRLGPTDPDLFADLTNKLENFWSEATLIPGDLSTANDQGLSFIPEGCTVKQLALQQEPIFAEDSRYFISATLWNKMTGSSRAVLLLHEIIYRYALEHRGAAKNSVPVRYFNSLIISDKFKDISPDRYREIYFQVFRIDQEPFK